MTMTMTDAEKVAAVEAYRTTAILGTTDKYQHGLMRRLLYTDGAKFVADTCGAHWLIDLIASWQLKPKVRREPFQVWSLAAGRKPRECIAVCEDGNGNRVASQRIHFSDFPAGLMPFKFWCERGGDGQTIMLPEER